MLPELEHGTLPEGIHRATFAEVSERFGRSDHRARLLRGFAKGANNLYSAGCQRIWLDGSFVTNKERPSDFDAVWDTSGVDPTLIDPVLLDFEFERFAQKLKFGGEFFPNEPELGSGQLFIDFFQNNKVAGGKKGIVEINLNGVLA